MRVQASDSVDAGADSCTRLLCLFYVLGCDTPILEALYCAWLRPLQRRPSALQRYLVRLLPDFQADVWRSSAYGSTLTLARYRPAARTQLVEMQPLPPDGLLFCYGTDKSCHRSVLVITQGKRRGLTMELRQREDGEWQLAARSAELAGVIDAASASELIGQFAAVVQQAEREERDASPTRPSGSL